MFRTQRRMDMERWTGRVAVVTGAAGGIGSAIVTEFVRYGITVVGIDLVENNLSEFEKKLKSLLPNVNFHGVRCDLTDENDIVDTFKWIEEHVGPISILINNAVIATGTMLLDISSAEINKLFQTNVIAPILCAKEAVNSMLKNDIRDGNIINVNSIAGVYPADPCFVPVSYSACKHALAVVSDGLRKELRIKKSSVKVTNLCPGWVRTNLSKYTAPDEKLEPEDVAAACISILQMPKNILIPQLVVEQSYSNKSDDAEDVQ